MNMMTQENNVVLLGIISDMDGVLCDSEHFIREAGPGHVSPAFWRSGAR